MPVVKCATVTYDLTIASSKEKALSLTRVNARNAVTLSVFEATGPNAIKESRVSCSETDLKELIQVAFPEWFKRARKVKGDGTDNEE